MSRSVQEMEAENEPAINAKPTDLYRHFDSKGVLLYVGISLYAIHRLSQHKKTAHWFEDLVRVDIEKFPSRRLASWAEYNAIQNENPLWNIQRKAKRSNAQISAQIEKEAKVEAKSLARLSRELLLKRLVSFEVTYTISQIADLLQTTTSSIDRDVRIGHLSTFKIKKKSNWHTRVSGWQFIDYIEWLQTQEEWKREKD